MLRKLVITLMLIVALALPTSAFALDVGDPAPSFEGQTTGGDRIVSAEMKGKSALFLVFWATWCPVCKTEIPKIKDIHAKYATKGMPMIAIDVGVNDSLKKVEKYLEANQITYPVIFDEGSTITKLYGVRGTPTVVIVDKGGIVRYHSAAIPDDLKDHFTALIKKP